MCYPRLIVKVFVSPTVKATGYWSNHRSSRSRTFSATGASSGTQSVVWSPRETQDTLATCPLLRGDDLTSSGWWGCLPFLSYMFFFLTLLWEGHDFTQVMKSWIPSKSWEATDSCMPRIAGLGMSLRMIRCLCVDNSNYDKCILLWIYIYIYTNSIMLSLRILDQYIKQL